MNYLISIVCLGLMLFSYLIERKVYNPSVLFNFWWGITILISGMGFFTIEVPTDETYLYLLLVILSFNVPTVFIRTRRINRTKNFNEEKKYNLFFSNRNNKIIILFQLIVMLFLLSRSINVLQIMLSGIPYSSVRYHFYYSDLIVTTQYGMLLHNIFIMALIMFGTIYYGNITI